MATFEIYKSNKSTAWYYRLRASGTQEITLESEGYATRNAALEGIESAKRNARFDQNFEVKESLFFSFLLRAGSGETVGISKKYVSEVERDNALKLVKREAPGATIVE